MAEKNPGRELALDRPPEAYPWIMQYMNIGKVSGITVVADVIREAKFLGLEELMNVAMHGNFYGWRCDKSVAEVGMRAKRRSIAHATGHMRTLVLGHYGKRLKFP